MFTCKAKMSHALDGTPASINAIWNKYNKQRRKTTNFKTHLAFFVFCQFFIFMQTKVFRIVCFLSFRSSFVANSLIAKPERVALSKLCTLQSLIKRYLIYTITISSQSALNIILGTWNIFYNLLQKLQSTFRFELNFRHMTDIPTVTFYNKILLAGRTVSCYLPLSSVSDGWNFPGDHSPNGLSVTAWQGTLFFFTLLWQLLHL